MNRILLLGTAFFLFQISAQAQLSFSNSNSLLNQTFNSGGCVGVSDMNGDGLDDIVHMNASRWLMIEYQNPDGSFTLYEYGMVSDDYQWGMCVGDVDNNGHNDVFSGGSFDGVHLVMIDAVGNSELVELPGSTYMQGCNMFDMNNDGWLDILGLNDVAESLIWGNDGDGNLNLQNDWIDMATVPPSDNSGNYGSVWTDVNNDGHMDLYIAKCRQGVSNPNDPRRINVLFMNDGNGNFTEDALARGLVIYSQSWTADFADIDNDGDMDCLITNHDNTLILLENDGNGYFTDITSGSGLEVNGFFLQCIMKDFDNDGFVDVLYSGGTHGFLFGNGDGTFTPQNGMFPNNDVMHSFAVGDLNNDGALDVYSSYGGGYVNPDFNNPDILWLNNGNDNNYLALNLEGTESNRNAIGTRVEIYGEWGVQIREVRSGESYGINNSFQIHFGLGTAESIDSLVIKWPAGGVETIENIEANQTLSVIENTCISQPVAITSDGPSVICDGSSVILTATEGTAYLWSTGEDTQSIEVSDPGSYSVTVYSEGGCYSNSPLYTVEIEPDQTPDIEFAGALEFCEGESVILISSNADSYEWSNGAQTQSIEVTEGGIYTVTIQGECSEFTSEEIEVIVNESPDAPMAEGDVIPAPGVAELTAVGENLRWYDVPTGGEILGTGPLFETPFITETTSFYVEDANIFGGETEFGGKENNSGNGAMHTNAAYWLVFETYEDIIIKSVVVYAQGDGERTIQVVNSSGDVVAGGTFYIEAGESTVELNFEVPEGAGYGLRATGTPMLYRNSTGSNLQYPYELGDMGAITGTNIDGGTKYDYYYFFYNWEVQRPITACVSERTEAVATIDTTTSIADQQVEDFVVFPVPADEWLNIQLNFNGPYELSVFDIAGKVHLHESRVATAGAVSTIVTANLNTGLYLIRVISDGQTMTKKVVLR